MSWNTNLPEEPNWNIVVQLVSDFLNLNFNQIGSKN